MQIGQITGAYILHSKQPNVLGEVEKNEEEDEETIGNMTKMNNKVPAVDYYQQNMSMLLGVVL